MGLLDNRDPPTYSEKLEKLAPLEGLMRKVLNFRKPKLVTGRPEKGVRIFMYQLLVQQGLPGGVKGTALLAAIVFPIVGVHLFSASFNPYRRDPFR